MLFSIIVTNPKRRIFFIFIILPYILIAIIIFRQQHNQTLQNTSVSYDTTVANNIRNKEHVARIHQPLTSSILRGILIFYPHDQEIYFLSELLWLYRSWIEMMKNEPSLWRTDLVIYTGNYTLSLQQLGCVYNRIRINREEPPQCRVFPYECVRLRDRTKPHNVNNYLYEHLDRYRLTLLTTYLRTYPYLDSINIIAENYPSYSMYDYILRTDIDVFLTKNFGHFVPYNDTLLVGHGGYSTHFNNARLKRIARDMNWLYGDLVNLGSTWYGPSRIAQHIANLSVEAMLYLSINEFTTPEKDGRLGTLLWPEWHYGVLGMYGSELAINHLILSENIDVGLADELLDRYTTDTDQYDLEKYNRLHLHCWHTDLHFSKFEFKAGKYDHLNPNMFINDTSASAYAMRMALESRLMSSSDLKQALINAKKFI